MKTKITELLNIEYPIIQGAMGWVAQPPLIAAVSNAGGLGILGSSYMYPDEFRKSIGKIKELTKKPFAVNFMPDHPKLGEILDIIIAEGVSVVSYGKGNPQTIIERTKPHGIINMPTVGAVNHALQAEKDGADAIIVQGTEGGGHTGHVATQILVNIVAEKVKIPVVAAGGFGDGKGLVSAFVLGAEGISMDTRFIVTQECTVPYHIKEWIAGVSEEDTVITDNLTGIRCRVLKNQFAQSLLDMKEFKVEPWKMMEHAKGRMKKAFIDGDLEWGSIACGQVAGIINDIPTCEELIERIVKQAIELIDPIREKLFSPDE